MAYYAFLDDQYIVTEVITGRDETDPSENWEEYYGAAKGQMCKRTSFNTSGGVHLGVDGQPDGGVPFRLNYAGFGYTYDPVLDGFIVPKPYPSWLLDTKTGWWDAPVPYPNDGRKYYWDETTLSWVPIE